jgi:hypothetical protein
MATAALADGEPLSFRQDPPILLPDHSGPLSLREVTVVGDVATVRFKRFDPDVEEGQIETWNRVTTRTIAGTLVSLFEPSWPEAELARVLRDRARGFDYPLLFWGEFLLPGQEPPATRAVYLRLGSTNLPASRVIVLDSTVQFASHVVNVVVPTFGDTGLTDDGVVAAARKFYDHFGDTYDSLAFIPELAHVTEYDGAHVIVKNQVRGIGLSPVDDSSDLGSAGTLQAIEVYPQASFTTNATSSHEIAHQWGNYLDWTGIAGIARAGHDPSAHAPLWAEGETFVGAVLEASRRVRRMADAGYEIERTPAPLRQHPIELYAMGKLRVDQVPDFVLFEEQGQFSGTESSTPEPGIRLTGGVKTVNINDILRAHGPRSGPSPTEWRRATVVVSREALVSQREMDYWNFFAQRLEDRGRTGVLSFDGYSSFEASTGNLIDLKSDVTPKMAGKIEQLLDVDDPRFGRRDWRGIEFDDTVPSRYRAGERVRLTGRLTATDRSDFEQIMVGFLKVGGSAEDRVVFAEPVSRSGLFAVDVQFAEANRGLYAMAVYLFWPDAGVQSPRSILSPVRVE